MKTETYLLLEDAAKRAGKTVYQLLFEAGKSGEFSSDTKVCDVINHIAGQEYERQQRESAL